MKHIAYLSGGMTFRRSLESLVDYALMCQPLYPSWQHLQCFCCLFSRIFKRDCTFPGRKHFLSIWVIIELILLTFLCHCKLHLTLGLWISWLMKPSLGYPSNARLYFLTLVTWCLKAPNISRNFYRRFGRVKLIFCTLVVAVVQGDLF